MKRKKIDKTKKNEIKVNMFFFFNKKVPKKQVGNPNSKGKNN